MEGDIFAKADEALDEKLEQSESVEAPSQEVKSEVTEQATMPDVPDLAKLGKFILEGKEVSYQDLVKERMLHSDYTRKTQEIAESRRQFEQEKQYADKFHIDFQTVLQNPNLVGEFKRIYPKQYHQAIDVALSRLGTTQSSQTQQQGVSQEQLIEKIIQERIGPIQDKLNQYEIDGQVKQLDGIFSEMKTKYPNADEEFVLARLNTMKEQGVQIDKAKIEDVHRYFEDRIKNWKETYHQEQLTKQKSANSQAKDVPSGGSTPGQAPKKFKFGDPSLDKALIEHLRGG